MGWRGEEKGGRKRCGGMRSWEGGMRCGGRERGAGEGLAVLSEALGWYGR